MSALPKSDKQRAIGAIAVLLIAIPLLFSFCSKRDGAVESKKWVNLLHADQKTVIETFEKNGTFVIDTPNNRLFVDPVVWHDLDVITKERLIRSVSLYMGDEKKEKYVSFVVQHPRSGKILATYDAMWGKIEFK